MDGAVHPAIGFILDSHRFHSGRLGFHHLRNADNFAACIIHRWPALLTNCTIGASKSLFKVSKTTKNSTGLNESTKPDVFKLHNTCYQQRERGEKTKLPLRETVRTAANPSILKGMQRPSCRFGNPPDTEVCECGADEVKKHLTKEEQ
jgi:hypothetical protein